MSCESGYWKFEKWKWKINLFHFFREVKSEIKIWFTLFEKWKVKDKSLSLFPRSEKWTENLVHSFREWKVKWKCLEIEIEKWNFSRILEKFFKIKKIPRFWSKCFSSCKLLLWNVEKGETCEKSWVSNVWVTFNCIAISGIIYQILISDFRFGKASFNSENLTLILPSVGKKYQLGFFFLVESVDWKQQKRTHRIEGRDVYLSWRKFS